MIATMAREVDAGLKARGFVAPIAYGPRRFPRTLPAATEIIVERDRKSGDAVSAPTGANAQPNAKARVLFRRDQGVRVTIYAQSTLEGARVEEHEHLCDDLVDAVLTEVWAWMSAANAGPLTVAEARYLGAEDFDGANFEQWAGVAYVIRFAVPRGVRRVNFAGEGRPTAKPAGVANRTDVTLSTGGSSTGCNSIT